MVKFQEGDKVRVIGLDMAFIVVCHADDSNVKLLIEGESPNGWHHVINARPEVLLVNDGK